MHAERALVPAEQVQTRQALHPRQSNIPLPVFKHLAQVHYRLVQTHALAFMHRHRPREAERQLRNTGALLAIFLYHPVHWFHFYAPAIFSFYDRHATPAKKIRNYAERAVNEILLRVVLREHDNRAFF